MEDVIDVTQVPSQFGELVRHVVEEDQLVVVEQGGEPQVVILSVATYERLISAQGSPDWRAVLERASALRERIQARRGNAPLPLPEEIIHSMRDTRDAELTSLR